MEIIGIYCRYL